MMKKTYPVCLYAISVFRKKNRRITPGQWTDEVAAQGYEPTYRTINRFRASPGAQELLRQCFVQFRCELVQEGSRRMRRFLLKEHRLKPTQINSHLFGVGRLKRYSATLVEKSNRMYDELLEKEIIPGIERESLEEISDAELLQVAEHWTR